MDSSEKEPNNTLNQVDEEEKIEFIKSVVSTCYCTLFHIILTIIIYKDFTLSEYEVDRQEDLKYLMLFLVVLGVGIVPHIIFEKKNIEAVNGYFRYKGITKSLSRKILNILNIINILMDIIIMVCIIIFVR